MKVPDHDFSESEKEIILGRPDLVRKTSSKMRLNKLERWLRGWRP